MSKQTFVANTILTAQQMNTLQANDYNQTVSTKTASYTLIASDVGTKIVMNSASATTITVNTSLFAAGDNLTIANISTGVCTVTAGTATVSSAGPLAIPQYGGGTLYFTSAGVSTFFGSAGPAASSGLTFIARSSLSGSNTLTMANVFSSTYTNYLIHATNLFDTVDGTNVILRLGTSSTPFTGSNYSQAQNRVNSGTIAGVQNLNGDGFTMTSGYLSDSANFPTTININLFNPNTTSRTTVISQILGNTNANALSSMQLFGTLNTATQYTDLFLVETNSYNTSGTITVYGYANS